LTTEITATFEKGRQDIMDSLEDEVKVVPALPTLDVSMKTGEDEKRENIEFQYIS